MEILPTRPLSPATQSEKGRNQKTPPLFLERVAAGFPSPADDYLEEHLDLNEKLVPHPSATYFVRVQGDSMRDAGIFSGDLLIVDRSIQAQHGNIVIAVVESEFTVKRLYHREGTTLLLPENIRYRPIEIVDPEQLQIWGVVTYVIHDL